MSDALKYIDSLQIIERAKEIQPVAGNRIDLEIPAKPKEEEKILVPAPTPAPIQESKTETKASKTKSKQKKEKPPMPPPADFLNKDNIIAALKVYKKAEMARKNSYEKKTLSISEDLCQCVRRTFYSFMGERAIDAFDYPYGELASEIGNTIHDILQKRISADHVEFPLKIEILGRTISMRFDMLLNKHVVVEFKTADSIPKEPKPEYIRQAVIYSYFLNKYTEYKVDLIQIVYVSRGKIDVGVFDIRVTQEMLNTVEEAIYGFITTLNEYLEKQVPPPMDNRFTRKDGCFFCPYGLACKNKTKYKSISKEQSA